MREAFTLESSRILDSAVGADWDLGHTPFERWSVDYDPTPLGRCIPHGQRLHNFNNVLLRLLAAIRQDKAADRCQRHPPAIQEEIEKGTPLVLAGLKLDFTNLLKDMKSFLSVLPQGSASRATCIEDLGGFEWGADTASDLDLVGLFRGSPTVDYLKALREDLFQVLGERFHVEIGKYGLVLKVPMGLVTVEVDLIPAVVDATGGHWILDSSTQEVLHNDPMAIALKAEEKIGSMVGWADLVVLAKFWNKRHAVMCDDGKKRAPFSSLHLEAMLLALPGPLPKRLDEALLLALQFIRQHSLDESLPSGWTGRSAADYFRKDVKRRNNAKSLLKRQSDVLQTLISERNAAEDAKMWKKVLGNLEWLANHAGWGDDEENRADHYLKKS